MSDLRLPMNELTFEELVTLGRSVIPSTSSGWTDHNVHDPGIMLMELMAWIAEAQMYSLGRLRRDERLAYARLLDVEPQGPQPARGLIWPSAEGAAGASAVPPWSEGRVIAAKSRVEADRRHAPPFYTTDDVALTTARLVAVKTVFADGRTPADWTAVNSRGGATFQPFGPSPAKGDRLALTFALPAAAIEDFTGRLSIGIEIVNGGEPPPDASVRRSRRLVAFLEDESGTRPVTIRKDSTDGFLRSGVLLVDFGEEEPAETFTLLLSTATGGFVRSPRVRRISPNVLPVVQREVIEAEFSTLRANAPDQTCRLARQGLMFPDPEGAVQVQVSEDGSLRPWRVVDSFDSSGPDDRDVVVDYTTATLTFGNGINGFLPTRPSEVAVRYRVCAGSQGNLPAGQRWRVEGVTGEFGINSEQTAGGLEARGLPALQAIVQERARRARPIVTAGDLEQAARAFADLDVNRAVELPPASRRPRGTRTLVVLSGGDRTHGAPAGESSEFLDEVRLRLAPRLPVGQRLEVSGPRYVPVRIRATLDIGARFEPAAVRSRVIASLCAKLSVVAGGPNPAWPFGRDVTAPMVRGWLRALEGVLRVAQVQLLEGGSERMVDAVRLGPRDLPRLRIAEDDVEVRRPAAGGWR
jgi:predicted phage baseplate assembly protein